MGKEINTKQLIDLLTLVRKSQKKYQAEFRCSTKTWSPIPLPKQKEKSWERDQLNQLSIHACAFAEHLTFVRSTCEDLRLMCPSSGKQ